MVCIFFGRQAVFMTERITQKTLAEFEAFNQSHPKGNFAQSSYWAKQKPMWHWEAVACLRFFFFCIFSIVFIGLSFLCPS